MPTNASPALHSLPSPLELRDGDVLVGRIDGDVVSFRGFGSQADAAQAAAIAHQAMLRRLARGSRDTSSPNESDLAAVRRASDHANGRGNSRPVASVLRAVVDGIRGGNGGDFAFEIRVPPPIHEVRMRGMAYVMYRALRSSGVAWPLLRPAVAPEELPVGAAQSDARKQSAREGARARRDAIRRFLDRVSREWALPWPRPQRAG
jgi:hypothetical protein